jgi:transcription elongation factor GreA
MRNALITRAGMERLTKELEHLSTAGRREVAERIRHALATDANVIDNRDYQDARADQDLLERRIAVLRERITFAELAEPDEDIDAIEVGERVRVRDLDTGAEALHELVGVLEADPFARRISIESPLGLALLGRRPGDTTTVEAPNGRLRLRILDVERPSATGSPEPARPGRDV